MLELNNRNVAYGYDNDYRLSSETITSDPGPPTVSYVYDNVGNRTSMTSTLTGVPGGTFTYDANDRLSIDTFNANGDTTSSGGITNTYDFEDRLKTHGSVSIVYDGEGNRVSETAGGVTTKYLVDDLNPTGLAQVLDETVSGSVTRTYAYGLQRITENQLVNSTWTPSFYGYDGHGSVRFLANKVPSITDSYDLDAFGMPIRTSGTTPNQFLYGGERYDSSVGLYDLRARYYNQTTGRFLSADPEDGNADKLFTLHKYLYAGDDPVDNSDPSGRQAVTETLRLYRFTLSPWVIRGLVVTGAAIACGYVSEGSKSAAYEAAGPFGTVEMSAPCYWKGTRTAAPPAPVPVPIPIPVPIAGAPANPWPPRCKELGDAVQAAKDVASGLGKCTQGMSEWQLQTRYDAWVDLGQSVLDMTRSASMVGMKVINTRKHKHGQVVAGCSQLLSQP